MAAKWTLKNVSTDQNRLSSQHWFRMGVHHFEIDEAMVRTLRPIDQTRRWTRAAL
jgi:hypothetical protein